MFSYSNVRRATDTDHLNQAGSKPQPMVNSTANIAEPGSASQSESSPTGASSGPIELRYTDRILLLGDSGSGKTWLAERGLARGFRRVVVVTSDPSEFREYPNRIVTVDSEKTLQVVKEVYDKGNCLLIIDDADNFFNRYEDDPRIKNLLILGRHRNVAWIVMARRPTDLPPLVYYQANKSFLFQTDHPRELALYRAYYPPGADETIKGLDRKRHDCFYFDRDTRQMRRIHI